MKLLPPLALLLLVSANSMAQESSGNPLLDSDWLFRTGWQRIDAEASIGLANPEFGTIPVIDFDALGVDPAFNSIWLEGIWQSPERWSVGFNYFQSKAEGAQTTSQDIEFGDLLIPAGTGVRTQFETKFYILNAYYDFYQGPNSVAGVGFGVYGLDLVGSIEVLIGEDRSGTAESADVLAPLPTASLYYTHAFNSHWAISADVDWFGLSINKYDGSMLAGSINVDYWINDHWGLGLGYSYVDLDLTVDEPRYDELYKVEYDSYFLYISFGF
jgi:hypothetical protein